MPTFSKRTHLSVSADALFAWHARPAAFAELAPAWIKLRLLKPLKSLSNGEITSFQLQPSFMPITWVARIQEVEPGRQFVDVQISGPFSTWRHRHLFEQQTANTCWMHDAIEYSLPLGFIGNLFKNKVQKDLERLFEFRHAKLIQLFGSPESVQG